MTEPRLTKPPLTEPRPEGAVERKCQGSVVEELPQLVFRIDLGRGRQILAHPVGMQERNFVRLLPGDKVEIELAAGDHTRGRILKKV